MSEKSISEKLSEATESVTHFVKENVEAVKEKLGGSESKTECFSKGASEDIYTQGKENIEKNVNEAQETISKGKEKVQESLSEGKEKLQESLSQGKEKIGMKAEQK